MELIEGIDDINEPYKNAVVTIGNFDGVHKGHQTLLSQVIKTAKQIHGTSIAITFDPHPRRVIKCNGDPPLITRYDQKVELIEKSGIDVMICIPFNMEFANIEAEKFVQDILVNKIGMKAIIIGKDYTFGKQRKGNTALLQKLGKKFGFKIIIPEWTKISDSWPERVSSTKIRELVIQGQVEEVPKLLGRFYQIRGKVVKGRNRGGRLLGFPTANIKLHDELCPKLGVYAVTVECSLGNYIGVANIGYSPTFDDHVFTIEVHILNFKGDIYNQRIRVNLTNRLRDEKKFANIDELSEQIEKDITKARELFTKQAKQADEKEL